MIRSILLLTLTCSLATAAVPQQPMDYLFQATPLSQVLTQINARQEINLVYDPALLVGDDDLPRTVTMDVRKVTPRQALMAVVASHGLKVEDLPGDITVITDPRLGLVSGPHGSKVPLEFYQPGDGNSGEVFGQVRGAGLNTPSVALPQLLPPEDRVPRIRDEDLALLERSKSAGDVLKAEAEKMAQHLRDNGEPDGQFTREEIENLRTVLRAGSLTVTPMILAEKEVDLSAENEDAEDHCDKVE